MTAKRTTTIKLTGEQAAAWQAAADACGMSRHAWMVAMLDVACGRSKLPVNLARLQK